ncbi:MAG: glutamate-1-semialdehyde-2,1-aminomutase [Acidobacteria bacterium]|nr:MAG: glutamate-1-semialdehyde-2,1-aminomutase [Acidobacteriota bacterium]
MSNQTSHALLKRARQLLPGGVNSPVRSFASVGGDPFFVARAEGSKIYDVDGREYIDYVCSYGPLILGHAHPAIVRAIQEQAERGTSYGAPTEWEVELADEIVAAIPSVDMVRFVNSGTEATMSAVRLARAFTGRKRIIKCEGCYHGHGDGFLSQAGSGLTTLGIASSPGVPDEFAGLTINVPFNNAQALKAALEEYENDVAAVILEPVPANMGVVVPYDGYLHEVRQMTRDHDVLLIFDEVITGFRLAYGGAQEYFGVDADLTCLGKIIGGGLPVGAYGGRRDIMQLVAPSGPVYQAGTLSGNPLAMRAGLEMLNQLKRPGIYQQLEETARQLVDELQKSIRRHGWPLRINHIGSMLTVFFTLSLVVDYSTAKRADTERYARYFHHMLDHGIFLAPSQFEAMFISTAHSPADIEKTAKTQLAVLRMML